jgi:Schitoviridae virion RNA polymerase
MALRSFRDFSTALNTVKAKQATLTQTAQLKKELLGQREETGLSPTAELEQQLLGQLRQQRANNDADIAFQEGQEQNSVAGKLGLEPGDYLHAPINMQASVISATSRVAGDLATGAIDYFSMAQEAGVPEEATSAYARYKNDTATEADIALLNGKDDSDRPDIYKSTYMQKLDNAAKGHELATTIDETMDISSIVDQRNRSLFSKDLAAGSGEGLAKLKEGLTAIGDDNFSDGIADFVSGAADLLANAGDAALDNPEAMFEYIAEMVPEVVLGSISRTAMAARTTGYGLETYRKGILKYQEEHNGEYPSLEDRAYMATHAVAAIAAEYVGDLAVIAGSKGVGKVLNKSEDVLTESIKQTAKEVAPANLLKSTAKVAGKTTGGAVGEGSTEGFQTYAEGEAELESASAEEIYEGAVIGAVAGGGISGGSSTTVEVANLLSESDKADQRSEAEVASLDDLHKQAVATGDITQLTDPKQPKTYHPGRAATALAVRIASTDTTAEEKADSRVKLDQLQEDTNNQVLAAEATVKALDPVAQEEAVTALAQAKERLATLPEEATEERNDLTELIGLREEAIADFKGGDKKAVQVAKHRLERAQNQAELVNTSLRNITAENQPDVESLGTLVRQAESTEDSQERTAAASQVINLMMENPDALDDATVERLANSAGSGFIPSQQAYLRTFSAAKTKQNELKALGTVSKNIFQGDSEYKGLPQYVSAIGQAIYKGDASSARQELSGIRKFMRSHKAKAAKVTEGLNQAQETGNKVYLIKDFSVAGTWRLSDTKPEGWSRDSNGGLVIHPNSTKLGVAIPAEAAAITATHSQMEAQYELAFNAEETAPVVAQEETPPVQEEPPTYTEDPTVQDEASVSDIVESDTQEDLSLTDAPKVEATPVEEDIIDLAALEANIEVQEEAIEVESGELVHTGDADQRVIGTMDNETFSATNLISAYFTQVAGKATDATVRPLVDVKDFLTNWTENPDLVSEFIVDGSDIFSEEQSEFFGAFIGYAKEWGPSFVANLNTKRHNAAFRHRDYINYLRNDLDADGTPRTLDEGQPALDENVQTALALAGFTWLVENTGGNGLNNKESINAMLGRDSDHHVSEAEYTELGPLGTSDKVIIAELGKKAVDALGLKAHKDAPTHVQAQLEGSLGAAVLAVLIQEGLIERVLSNSELLHRGDKAYNPKVMKPFIRVSRDWGQENNPVSPELEQIHDLSEGQSGVLSKVFGTEAALVAPTLEPQVFNQPTTKKTRQLIPEVLSKILDKVTKRKHFLREDMHRVRKAMSTTVIQQIAGYVELDGRYTQETRRKAIESKNNDITRDLERLNEFEESIDATDNGKKTPFYFLSSVWRQQRVGLVQNMVNPQTSKLQRHNVSLEAWNTEVDPKDVSGKSMTNFRLAVAQAMGIKTDKLLGVTSDEQLETKMALPVIKDAVAALQRADTLSDGELLTDAEQQSIAAAVKEGKEAFHSLDGLVNWAHYQTALKTGASFTTDIMYEVDGVTNGPALAHILLGAIEPGLGELFGFYGKDSEYKDYPSWKAAPGNRDLYETVARRITDSLQELVLNDPDKALLLNSLYYFTGELTEDGAVTGKGRSLVKQPLTALIFGSGTDTAIDGMADDFVESLYERLEAISNEGDAQKLQDALAHINRLMSPYSKEVDIDSSFEQAMELRLTFPQRKAIKDNYLATIGENVKETLNTNFGSFLETRSELNKAAQVTWEIYDIAFNHLKELEIQRKVEAGEVPTGKTGLPQQGLTATEEQAIREQLKALEPIVHTPLSKADKNLDAGLFMAKVSTGVAAEGDNTYTGDSKFDKDINNNANDKTQGTFKGLKTRATKATEVDPGVATVIMLVHSLDSAIAALTYNLVESLHVHDAAGYGLNDMDRGAELFNKNTMNVLTGYSLPMEINAALVKTTEGLTALLETHPELADKMLPVQARINDGKPVNGVRPTNGMTATSAQQAIGTFVRTNTVKALTAEVSKLKFLAQTETVNQYALEGGQHIVTQEVKEAIKKRLAQLQAKPVVGQKIAPVEEAPHEPVQVGDTAWGKLGAPKVESDPALVKLLAANPNMAVKDLIPHLARIIKSTTQSKQGLEFSLGLLRELSRTVNPNMKVRFITSSTQAPTKKLNVRTARGWYSLDANGETINIKSNQFIHSGVTAELLLHEMTHGALAKIIEQEEKLIAKSSLYVGGSATEAVKDLQKLQVLSKQYVETMGLKQYGPAVKNVQELVAWGMTNTGFQRDVLNKVQMPSKTSERTTLSGMRSFIQGMVKILFKSSNKTKQEMAENGMAILIANTGLIFEEAQKPSIDEQVALLLKQDSADPDTFTTEEIFDALGGQSSDPVYTAHLRSLMSGIASTAYSAFGAVKSLAERSATVTAEDTYLNALSTGEMPFASKALAHLKLSSQEAFVLESTEVVIRESLGSSLKARNELRKLFSATKHQMSVKDFHEGDWSTATQSEQDAAQATYDFIFVLERNEDGSSDFLSRFGAMGLAYKPLHDKLQQLHGKEDTRTYEGKSLGQRLVLFLDQLLQAIVHRWTNTHATQRQDQRLMALAQRLVQVEARKKATLKRRMDRPDTVIENAINTTTEKARGAVRKLSSHKAFRESKSGVIRATSGVVTLVAGDRVDLLFDGIKQFRDGRFKEKLGVTASIINEVKGTGDYAEFHVLLQAAKKHEQDRKHLKDETADWIRKSFNQAPTKDELNAITGVIVRTDMSKLLDHYKLDQLEKLISNPADLEAAIKSWENKLTGQYKGYYRDSGKALGHYMATGETSWDHLMMNAHNIAFLGGTSAQQNISATEGDQALAVLDPLISLYALRYTSEAMKNSVREVFREELSREDAGNGIEMVLKTHQRLQQESLNLLFGNDPVLTMKGYTKDIYNPYVEVVAVTEAQEETMRLSGYSKGALLQQDPADAGDRKRIYTIRDGGIKSNVTGIMSTTGKRSRGTSIHKGVTSVTDDHLRTGNAKKNQQIRQAKEATVNNMLRSRGNFDPTKSNGSRLVPIMNPAGEVVNYRYLMANQVKDALLDRDSRVDQVLGTTAASIFDKVGSETKNNEAVDALFAQYREEYATRPEGYIEFSAASTDKSIREAYQVLPEATKKHIRKVWGRNGMLVRNDIYDMTFGYRKYSITDMFDKESAEQNIVEQVLVDSIDKMFGPKAAHRIRQAEDMWGETVKVVKDILVIKNLFTFLGNATSNVTELLWFGVSPQDIAKNHVVALTGILNYQRDRKELAHLQNILDIDYVQGDVKEIRQRIIELEDALERNPVKELIDAGLYQTLVEDIDTEDESHSYKSRLARKTDEATQWLPQGAKTAVKTLFMTHDTALYKFMNQATHLSDFVARYTLHEHMISRRDNPMSRADSLQLAVDAFVNYDLPTHRNIQYLNDMGILWFTKYYLRIQRVLYRLYKDNPAKALSIMALGNFFPNLGNITESSFWERLDQNPIGSGAFQLPEAVDEIATVKAALSLVD